MAAADKTYTCIIVDDKEIDRLAVQAFLEDYPFMQLDGSFASAAEALEQLKQRPPAILISDIGMPGEDGYSLIRKVRPSVHSVPRR